MNSREERTAERGEPIFDACLPREVAEDRTLEASASLGPRMRGSGKKAPVPFRCSWTPLPRLFNS